MQTQAKNIQPQEGPNQQSNPLKQLFSYSLSPKQKLAQNNRQKLPSNSIQIGNKYTYCIEDLIGDGYTSKVYKGYQIEKTSKIYAIKVIDKKRLDHDQIKLIKNQIDLHPTLNHPNIVQCYDVYDTNNLIYIVLQWCNSGDLAQYIQDFKDKQIPEWRAIQFMQQIVSGCRYLVQNGVLHRDLKPANILRSGNTLKIADFGFAVKGKKTLIDSMSVGTPLYMPPQSLQECVYSHKSDFFSLGCIMYQLLNGRTPWYKNDEKALAKSMKNNSVDLSQIRNLNIKYFIQKACEISEGSRMSIDQFMSFDFKKSQSGPITLDLNLINIKNSQTIKPKVLTRQQTDRLVFGRSNRQQIPMAKSIKSKKSQKVMEATFVSNHIYFKGAKTQETKKITADFQQKFQFCLLLKYILENPFECILAEESEKKNLKIVLFRHCIFTFKKILNDLVRTKSFDLKSWCEYKETDQFKKFEEECKMMKQKMEKDFNLQLKGMSLKNLGQVNKKFPELISQYDLSKSFYEKLKQFLREILCHFHQQLAKKFTRPLSGQKQGSEGLSQFYEAFKSLYRYYQYCEQKQQQQDINKSIFGSTNLSSMKGSLKNTPTASNNTSSLLSSTGKIPYQMKASDEIGPGKKQLYNHLSPDCEKFNLSSTSPKSKYIFNRTAQKKMSNDGLNSPILKRQTNELKQHHYYACNTKPIITGFDSDLAEKLDKMVYIQSPKKKISFQNIYLKINDQKNNSNDAVRQQKLDSVESYFDKNLCKNFEQSKMTKQQYLVIKKKLKWLW